MRKVRLFWKLYPSYLLITVLSLLVAGWFMAGTLREFHVDQVAEDLGAKARLISRQIVGRDGRLLSPLRIDRYCKQMGKLIATRITVILPGGRVIGDSHKDPSRMDNHGDRPEVERALSGNQGSSIRHSHTLGTDMMYVALPVKAGPETVAVVRTAVALSAINHALAKIRTKILAGSVVAAVSVMAAVSLTPAGSAAGAASSVGAGGGVAYGAFDRWQPAATSSSKANTVISANKRTRLPLL